MQPSPYSILPRTSKWSPPTVREARVRNVEARRDSPGEVLPKRLATRWLDLHMPETWTNAALERLDHQLHEWTLHPVGTEGYDKAEVTAGGGGYCPNYRAKPWKAAACLAYFLSARWLTSRDISEGTNFQWAWASGAAAGRSL